MCPIGCKVTWPKEEPWKGCRRHANANPELTRRDQPAVSIAKKITHKAEAVKGSAKKAAGRATGNRCLRAEGYGDQVKGNTKLFRNGR